MQTLGAGLQCCGEPQYLRFSGVSLGPQEHFIHSISSQTCWNFLQQNHTPYCYLDLKCELKMEQKHPVTQMALSFRDFPRLQT